jgi:hypothetical protein
MADEFKIVGKDTQAVDVKFQLEKLYGQVFPSLASKAVFAIEGTKDKAKSIVTDKIGYGFKVDSQEAQHAIIAYSNLPEIALNEYNVYSYLGTPIVGQIIFKAGTYDVVENGKVIQRNIANDYAIPATCICEFAFSKSVAESKPNGANSSVKEEWSDNDCYINIVGFIITEGNNNGRNADMFPTDHINQLMRWRKLSDSIEVESEMFRLLGIKRIAIKDMSINDIRGFPNVKSLNIKCSSDEALELIIKNNQLGN